MSQGHRLFGPKAKQRDWTGCRVKGGDGASMQSDATLVTMKEKLSEA